MPPLRGGIENGELKIENEPHARRNGFFNFQFFI
jgi:hypothetical protein